MKAKQVKTALMLHFILISGITIFGQVPGGGNEMTRDPMSFYTKAGKGILTSKNINDQPFTKALEYITPADVVNPWDAQIIFQPTSAIETSDIILVAFYARTTASSLETGEGQLNVVIENKSTYAKTLYQAVTIGAEWKQYYAPVKADVSLAANNLNCAFFFGFPSQTVEVADIHFLNYKTTRTLEEMPETEITYIGREPDAPWRAEALERIENFRKGNISITVVDTFGNPVEGAEVSISMRRHKFSFGSAIVASEYLANATYREKIHELFNEVVFENDLKWPSFISKSGSQKNQVLEIIDDLATRNIGVRGHNVVWPSWKFLPVYLSNYKTQPDRLRLEVDKHIDEICSFTRNRLVDWDVINEPYSEHDLMDILGRDVMADWFKRVRNIDPYAKLYLNDYSILSGNGINYARQDAYIETIGYIEELGGEIDGIGLQGHFSSNLTPIARLKTVLDKFAILGKDIKVTEFDIAINQQQVQADYTRDFMTMVFSHPSVTGILSWGFWESRHWEPDAAIYTADWTIKPNGVVYNQLVFDDWWTKDTILFTDGSGKITLNGFLGTYDYAVKYNGKENSGELNIELPVSSGEENDFILSIQAGIPAKLFLELSGERFLCEGESAKLSVTVPQGFSIKWYNGENELNGQGQDFLVTSTGNYYVEATGKGIVLKSNIVDITVYPVPVVIMEASGGQTVCPGNTITLSANTGTSFTYKWFKNGVFAYGSVSSLDVGESGNYKVEVNSSGCRSTSQEFELVKLAAGDPACTVGMEENKEKFSVFPNPFQDSFTTLTTEYLSYPLQFDLINIEGKIVYNVVIHGPGINIFQPDIEEGFYNLRISAPDRVEYHKIIRQD